MLNEDALLLLLLLVACGLVSLGTLELLWPTRPRHPLRRSSVARDLSRRPPARLVSQRPAARPSPPSPPAAEPPPPPALTVVADAPAPPAATVVESPAALEPVAPPAPEPPVAAPAPAAAAPPEPSEQLTVLERGDALLKAGRYDDAVTLAQDGLRALKPADGSSPPPAAAEEAARLWGLTGLARQGLGDVEGARFAFEEAIAIAPAAERQTWERHLVSLSLTVGRRALAGAGTATPADRIPALTSAIEWLERGLAIAPGDPELREVVSTARDELWGTREAAVNDLLQRRALTEARRMLEDVIADPECPPERRLAFCRLLDGVNADAPRP
jgi:tetratricopeptide (TPR) repeat protein